MICDRCKKEEACLHIRGIDQEGNVRSLNLCARCAIEEITRSGGEIDDHFLEAVRQATKDMGPEILNLLQKNIQKLSEADDGSQFCRACGKRRREFLADYLLGCRECLKTFYKNIQHQMDVQFDFASILPGATGEKQEMEGQSHQMNRKIMEEKLQQLRREMDLAVRREEYELAGELQVKIRDCRAQYIHDDDIDQKKCCFDGRTGSADEYCGDFCENHRLAWLPRRIQSSPAVVLSSFVIAERNLENLEIPPFVNRFHEAEEAREILLTALKTEKSMGRMQFYDPDRMERDGLTGIHERGWCRPEFLLRSHARGIAVSENERIVCLLNDRNHLQMTFWGGPGQFPELLPAVEQMLEDLCAKVTFWKNTSGYVTRDVRYIGSGIRMGGIIHLPALTIAQSLRAVTNACKALGVTLMPFFSSGNEKTPLYMFYNSSTRNASLEMIAGQVKKVENMLVRHELECRVGIQCNPELRLKLCDLIGRAWGIIGSARLLDPMEGRSLLSLVWLGMEYGMLPKVSLEKIMQGLEDVCFYDMGELKKKLLPEGISVDKILAARFRHDIAGRPTGE